MFLLQAKWLAKTILGVALWSLASSCSAAADESLVLADGLMDKQAVCASFLHTQRETLEIMTKSWKQPAQAVEALDAELRPILSIICDKAWTRARERLAGQIRMQMSTAEQGVVYKFLSTSGGQKFVELARSSALLQLDGESAPGFTPAFTRDEKALAEETLSDPAWKKYRSVTPYAMTYFGEAQMEEVKIYVTDIQERIESVRARLEA